MFTGHPKVYFPTANPVSGSGSAGIVFVANVPPETILTATISAKVVDA